MKTTASIGLPENNQAPCNSPWIHMFAIWLTPKSLSSIRWVNLIFSYTRIGCLVLWNRALSCDTHSPGSRIMAPTMRGNILSDLFTAIIKLKLMSLIRTRHLLRPREESQSSQFTYLRIFSDLHVFLDFSAKLNARLGKLKLREFLWQLLLLND